MQLQLVADDGTVIVLHPNVSEAVLRTPGIDRAIMARIQNEVRREQVANPRRPQVGKGPKPTAAPPAT